MGLANVVLVRLDCSGLSCVLWLTQTRLGSEPSFVRGTHNSNSSAGQLDHPQAINEETKLITSWVPQSKDETAGHPQYPTVPLESQSEL